MIEVYVTLEADGSIVLEWESDEEQEVVYFNGVSWWGDKPLSETAPVEAIDALRGTLLAAYQSGQYTETEYLRVLETI